MGCLQSQGTEGITDRLHYPRQITLNISDPISKGKTRVPVSLPAPTLVDAHRVVFGDLTVRITSCVLPGIDPREEVNKECQDGLFIVQAGGQLLVGLFDGHGKEGKKIVDLCCRTLKGYFLAHLQEFSHNTTRAVEEALHQCDMHVKKETECSVSGT